MKRTDAKIKKENVVIRNLFEKRSRAWSQQKWLDRVKVIAISESEKLEDIFSQKF